MPRTSVDVNFLFTLGELQRLVRAYADKEAARFGMTRAQWAVLAKVERNEGLKQSELAEQMEMQPITLTRLIDKLAEAGLCRAAKDISMAGTLGTALMLLECSGVGAIVDLDAIPRPSGVPLLRWLTAFPSYGFILSVRPEHVAAVQQRFEARGLACAAVGEVKAARQLIVQQGPEWSLLWNLAEQPFIQGTPARGLELGSLA